MNFLTYAELRAQSGLGPRVMERLLLQHPAELPFKWVGHTRVFEPAVVEKLKELREAELTRKAKV